MDLHAWIRSLAQPGPGTNAEAAPWEAKEEILVSRNFSFAQTSMYYEV